MPYYKELFVNKSLVGSRDLQQHLIVKDSLLVSSFRTKPHPSALWFEEHTDLSMDPYAYFLESIPRWRYQEALQLRGLPTDSRPDTGHTYESIRHTVKSSFHPAFSTGSRTLTNAVFGYSGTLLDSIHNGDHRKLPSIVDDGLGTWAQQTYNRVAPTSVVFDAANFLGELRERLPSISFVKIKDTLSYFRSLGDAYVNVEFGWKPFVSGILDAAKALGRATEQLAKNGQHVHRRFESPQVVSQNSIQSFSTSTIDCRTGLMPVGLVPSGMPSVLGFPTPLQSFVTTGPYNQNGAFKRLTTDRWFEGQFSSYYPLNFNPESYFDRLNVLVNFKVTPETLWNLTPWTWLVDWYLRVGDSISANILAANDLLIMHYGYAMEKKVYTTGFYGQQPTQSGSSSWPLRVSSTTVTTRKRRIRANPYGFGVGGAAALNGSQTAILGALGLMRL